MEITDNLKESLNFPIQNYEKWLILGLLFLIIGIFSYLNTTYSSSAMSIINDIVDIVLGLILFGYSISILKSTINGDVLPQFDIVKNIVDGVKVAVLDFVYLIIPTIITILVAWGTGIFSNFIKLVTVVANNSTTPVPASLSASLGYGIIITTIVAIIVFVIFILFAYIGMARMAEYDSLKAGLSFVEVFHKIGSIGWMKYVGWFILFVIVLMVLSLISGLISLIPYVGTFIAAFIVSSFIMLFTYRSLGNVYNDG
ncbi:DUF4013 domain-containing protein [Methanobrevibacter acididurans]|uniref:DUF4013 domain-containing protein n=1 Tax=Methanobrevibacter acididurans TaxID=120963 RepID=UPI0038FCC1D6